MRTTTAVTFFMILSLAGCKNCTIDIPTSPSGSIPSDPIAATWVTQGNGCLGIQIPHGYVADVQIDAMQRLAAANAIKWVRLGGASDGRGQMYHDAARKLGLSVMTVIHGSELIIGADWRSIFDQHHALYPETRIWNIGGEITNPDETVNPNGAYNREEFWEQYLDLHAYIQERYPGTYITSPPTFGSGYSGAEELQWFFDHRLLDLDNVIIAFNLYTEAAFGAYQSVFRNPTYANRIANKPVWITETGYADPNNQESWVQTMYPRMQQTFGSAGICWYILFGGNEEDPYSHANYALIEHIDEANQTITARPLFHRLMGEQQ